MKFRNWIAVIIIMAVVTVGGIVFGQIQSARADEVSGTADNVTSANVTLGGKTLVIDANTRIIGDLVPGSSIKIKAQVQADGTLLATMIKVNNNNGNHDDAVSGNSTIHEQERENEHNNIHEQNGVSGNNTMDIMENIQNNQVKDGQWHQDNGRHLGNTHRNQQGN